MNARHQEVINRIEYMYKDVDGNINFPNSFDGDVLKIAYKSAKASLVHLNNNQKIVLEWLKKDKKYRPFRSIGFLDYSDGIIHDRPPKEVYEAYKKLDFVQQFEVLAAFAQWGLEQEEA